MGVYRKKPVDIEAVRFVNGKFEGTVPLWINDNALEGKLYRKDQSLFIKTLEGEMECKDGDWIIQGVKGEIYPCKPDIFAEIYEPVLTSRARPK